MIQLSDLLTTLRLTEHALHLPVGTQKADYQHFMLSDISLRADTVQKGSIFPLVKGQKFDALDFVEEAVQNGAALLLSERDVNAPIPVLKVPDLRTAIAQTADLFYPTPHLTKLAVTGTNGKTSVTYFTQQILNLADKTAASLGTIGIESPVFHQSGSMTTPDSVTLHRQLSLLSEKGVDTVVMEASSHGLDQERVSAIDFEATAFTNLTRDHLDYHHTMEAYLAAKAKLFLERTKQNGTVVLNADVPEYAALSEQIRAKGIRVISYGANGQDLKLLSRKPTHDGQDIIFSMNGQEYAVHLPLFGDFQVMNVLCAVGLCLASGVEISKIIEALPQLKAPAGRMEQITTVNGARVFVDYAHTPDALERVLISLRPHTKRRLVCLFGCGGNRDTGKRPQMGAIADRLADIVYITDDNPRFEEAASIRQAIKAACPKGIEIDGRERALSEALHILEEGDVLVVCGKGHETGQTIGSTVYQLNDKTEILSLTASIKNDVLWKSSELSMALNTTVAPWVNATGVSIDTRTLACGDLFIALKGENTDGHAYVPTAVSKGAASCIVDHFVPNIPLCKQILVNNTLDALESLARFARMRSEAVFIGITGSSGKTTTKEMLRTVLSAQGRTFATAGNLNNQIGVPLMLARLPLDTEYAVIEMGMNHFGEMAFLSELVRPNHTIITMIGAAHRAYFQSDDDIAVAKGEIYEYADRHGTAVLNKECAQFPYLLNEAQKAGIRRVITFGEDPAADFELTSCFTEPAQTVVHFRWHGSNYTYRIGFAGRHFALDSLGVLALVDAMGASVEQAMQTLAEAKPLAGRGLAYTTRLPDGAEITLIDDAYNANPKSVAASLNTLGAYREKRKIAVLGDMLELGTESRAYHVGLADTLIQNGIDAVFAIGPEMQALYEALPPEMQGAHTQTAAEMIPVLYQNLQANDAVLVKASNGMGLKQIITALTIQKTAV